MSRKPRSDHSILGTLFMRQLMILPCLIFSMASLAAEPPKGFQSLFNGKDLTGWHGWAIHAKGGSPADLAKLTETERAAKIRAWTDDAHKHWRVEQGELINDGHGAYLATDKLYGDIELLIEYKTVPKADSGIYLRATPQVQIWDSTEEAKFKHGADKGSGGLWNNPPDSLGKDPLVKADRPFGEWNSFRIIQVGERTSVWLNGQQVVDFARMHNYWNKNLPLTRQGEILLQTHGGEIRWRNIFIREIPAEEANQWLATHANKQLKQAFNGKDFTGWTGATDKSDIVEGKLVSKGGVLYTKAKYKDFTASLEYKLPPGGNNGLAIRYPGNGDPAYTGMCEIQILDDEAPKHRKLDPRQYNGSAYGKVAAHRGYQRPIGEWNFEVVKVVGSNITVELNGTQILDADLSKLQNTLGDKTHSGRGIAEGHFGFCGYGDAVEFRNIMIK